MKLFKGNTFSRVLSETNILDSAIGLTVAYVFVDLVNSFVSNIFNPIIGLLFGGGDLTDLQVSLKFFPNQHPYSLRYGIFFDALIQFIIVFIIVYWAAKIILRLKRRYEKKHGTFCSCCYMKIPKEAKLCPYCRIERTSH